MKARLGIDHITLGLVDCELNKINSRTLELTFDSEGQDVFKLKQFEVCNRVIYINFKINTTTKWYHSYAIVSSSMKGKVTLLSDLSDKN